MTLTTNQTHQFESQGFLSGVEVVGPQGADTIRKDFNSFEARVGARTCRIFSNGCRSFCCMTLAMIVLFCSFTPQSNPRYFASPTKLSFLSFHTFLPPDVVVAL